MFQHLDSSVAEFILSFHAPVERHRRMKMRSIGSWFDRLTTSGRDPVRPEALEGRTGYSQSSYAEGLFRNDTGRFETVPLG